MSTSQDETSFNMALPLILANSTNTEKLKVLEDICKRGYVSSLEIFNTIDNSQYNNQFANGNYSLHVACFGGHSDLVIKLKSYGANIETLNNVNETPLIIACKQGYVNLAKKLIELGADYNRIIDGKSICYAAIWSLNAVMVEYINTLRTPSDTYKLALIHRHIYDNNFDYVKTYIDTEVAASKKYSNIFGISTIITYDSAALLQYAISLDGELRSAIVGYLSIYSHKWTATIVNRICSSLNKSCIASMIANMYLIASRLSLWDGFSNNYSSECIELIIDYYILNKKLLGQISVLCELLIRNNDVKLLRKLVAYLDSDVCPSLQERIVKSNIWIGKALDFNASVETIKLLMTYGFDYSNYVKDLTDNDKTKRAKQLIIEFQYDRLNGITDKLRDIWSGKLFY